MMLGMVRRIAALGVLLATAATHAAQLPDEMPIKDPESGSIVAVITLCNDCKSAADKGCYTGAEVGWLNGAPCGKCLVDSNFPRMLKYPYDLQILGTLVDPSGKPVKDRFVQAFLPNGWTVRGRTSEAGTFRLMLGATAERKSKQALVTDIGTRVDTKKGNDQYYALFLLPESYRHCSADAAKTEGKKSKGDTATKK